jgi:sulfur carrier protein
MDGVRITLNGEARDVEGNTTVRQLVEQRGLSVQKVAVELNRRLLRTEKYDTELKEADEVEIVTFVGGG